MVRPLRLDQILVPSLPSSQWFTEWIMCPLCWSNQLFALLPPWKKENYVFATDLAIWNSSRHPFLGLKLLSLKVPSHCALYQLVLEKSWIVYVQNFLNFVLFWNFAFWGWGALATPSGCESSLEAGLAVCWSLKVSFPTQYPIFDEVFVRFVRCASCSLLA